MDDRYDNPTADLLAEEQVEIEEPEQARPRSGLLQRATYLGVVLFCAVYFFRPEDFWLALASVPLAKIVGIFTGVALLFAVLIEKAELPKEGKILLGLLAYLSICIPFSYWPGGSVEVVLQVFAKTIVIAIAAMVSITSGKQLRRLMMLQVLAMVVMSAIAVGQPKMHDRMYGVGNLFSDPNDFALNLCLVLAFAMALAVTAKRVVGKMFWIGSIGLILIAIVMTGSRGGFLALLATMFGLWRRFRVGRTASIAIMVFVLLFGVGAAVVAGGSGYFERIASITNMNADITGSSEARYELLTLSLITTVKHPLFGIGPGQFENFSGAWHLTHNTYTELSSEAGLPSLALFIYLLIASFRRFRVRSGDKYLDGLSAGLYGALFGYMVGALFLSTAYLFVQYLLIAYVSAVSRIKVSGTEDHAKQEDAAEEYQYDVPGWEEPQHEH